MDAADHELHCFNLIVQIDAVSHTNSHTSTLLLRLRSEVDNVRFLPKTDYERLLQRSFSKPSSDSLRIGIIARLRR